jgi:hypothetical protein
LKRVLTFLAAGAILAPLPARSHASHAGGVGLFDVRTATVPAHRTIHLGLTGTHYVVHPEDEVFLRSDRSVWDGGLSISGGVLGWLELFARADAVFYSVDDYTPISLADGLLGAKAQLPWRGRWIEPSVLGSLNLPWGTRGRGYSSDSIDPALAAVITIPLPDPNPGTTASLHFNFGYHFHLDEEGKSFEDKPTFYLEPVYPREENDRIDLRTAVEFGSRRVTLFAELLCDDLVADEVSFRENPLFLTPGFRAHLWETLAITLGTKIALASDDPNTTRFRSPEDLYPDWQLIFGLNWSWLGPEDKDKDGDRVPDQRDRCPDQAEDRDGFEDDDGCPDSDNDKDGVKDAFDARPNEAEDFDGYQDSDGVPELDNDGDKLADKVDLCPDEAEDFDHVADHDGCPEMDADGDGIMDMSDKCPEQPEIANGIDDNDGCPERVGLLKPSILRGVLWQAADISPTRQSFPALHDLVKQLHANAEQSIELRVHPNLAIGEITAMQRLASIRADYLREFFANSGLAAGRIEVSTGSGINPALLDKDEQIVGTGIVEVIPISPSEPR